MGFFSSVTRPFRDLDHAVRNALPHGVPAPPKPPGIIFTRLRDETSGGQSNGGLSGFLSHVPFPPGLVNSNQPARDAAAANAEQRLNAFVDAQGQPLWKTPLEREALLSVLRQDPGMTVEKWQRGQDMARLSRAVYAESRPPEGYRVATAQELGLDPSRLNDPATGLRATVYLDERTGNYTLAFAGTDGGAMDKTDWKNGNSQAFNPHARQYAQAIDLAQTLQRTLGAKFTDITGQSLGGGLAAAASTMTGVRATTFNAAGLNPDTIRVHGGSTDPERMRALITNYRVEGDPLTEAQEGSNIDPATAYLSRRGGHMGRLAARLGEGLAATPSPVQNSYITGPLAQQLPDAAGTQVTLFAIAPDGHRMSRQEQMSSGNWAYLHGFDSINLGMQNRAGPTSQVVTKHA